MRNPDPSRGRLQTAYHRLRAGLGLSSPIKPPAAPKPDRAPPGTEEVAYVEPWRAIAKASERNGLTGSLEFEVTEGHPLWMRGARVFARSDATDDVVAVTADGVYAIVHLTWSSMPETPPWPLTSFHTSQAELTRALYEWSDWSGYLDE